MAKASDRAYAALLDEIQHGVLGPGTIVVEAIQAERFGISRTPMREAIRRLIAEGLVTQQSPRVLVVSDFDADGIRDLFDARRALEEMTARLAATRRDPATFAELADAFLAAQPANDVDGYYALIERFDTAVDDAADNAYLAQSLRTVRAHLARARRVARDHEGRLHASAGEHALIAQAIADGNEDLAAHATHVHLHNALTSILSVIEPAEHP